MIFSSFKITLYLVSMFMYTQCFKKFVCEMLKKITKFKL